MKQAILKGYLPVFAGATGSTSIDNRVEVARAAREYAEGSTLAEHGQRYGWMLKRCGGSSSEPQSSGGDPGAR